MEVAENTTAQSKLEKAKQKTVQLKDNVGHYISETPLFKALKGKAQLYFQNPEELNNEITQLYNEATHEEGKKTVATMWEKIQKLFYMVRDSINNRYTQIPKAKIVIGMAVIIYAVLPSDLIPDVLPALGFADDAALLAWFVKHAAKEIHQYEEWQANQGQLQNYAG